MNKKLILISLLVLFFVAPIFTHAQSWSPQQKEVWTSITAWWDNAKANNTKYVVDMTHEDYKGWSFDTPFPMDKSELTHWATNVLPKRKVVHTSLKPLEILVSGDVAVVHYFFSEIRMVEDKEKTVTGRWTDIWKKENGKWMLYADSGGNDEVDD